MVFYCIVLLYFILLSGNLYSQNESKGLQQYNYVKLKNGNSVQQLRTITVKTSIHVFLV